MKIVHNMAWHITGWNGAILKQQLDRECKGGARKEGDRDPHEGGGD